MAPVNTDLYTYMKGMSPSMVENLGIDYHEMARRSRKQYLVLTLERHEDRLAASSYCSRKKL